MFRTAFVSFTSFMYLTELAKSVQIQATAYDEDEY